MVERATTRGGGGGGFARKPPADGGSFHTSSDDHDSSFRKRQAGMLDSQGKGLSTLRIGAGGGRGGDGGRQGSVSFGGGSEHRGSVSSVTTQEVEVS